MREIEYGTLFKKDYRRVKKGQHGALLDDLLGSIVDILVADRLKPDLVLICQKRGADTLRLVRLGSHAELGL